MKISNNPVKYEVPIKQYLRSILDMSKRQTLQAYSICVTIFSNSVVFAINELQKMTFVKNLMSVVTYFVVAVAVVVFVDVFYESFSCVFDVYAYFFFVFFSIFSVVVCEIVSFLHLR